MTNRPESGPRGVRRDRTVRLLLGANVVLLGALAWTQLADRPLVAADAVAGAVQSEPPRFPNAADQRRAIEKAVRDLQKSVDRLAGSIDRGGIRVEVTNAEDIAAAVSGDDG